MNNHNWKSWKIGDQIKWSWNEFDGKGSLIGEVTIKENDHLIVTADKQHLWVDDDFSYMFQKVE